MSEERVSGWEKSPKGTLRIPEDILDELREIANRHRTTETEVVKGIFKIGFMVIEAGDKEGATFLIKGRDGDETAIEVDIAPDPNI